MKVAFAKTMQIAYAVSLVSRHNFSTTAVGLWFRSTPNPVTSLQQMSIDMHVGNGRLLRRYDMTRCGRGVNVKTSTRLGLGLGLELQLSCPILITLTLYTFTTPIIDIFGLRSKSLFPQI